MPTNHIAQQYDPSKRRKSAYPRTVAVLFLTFLVVMAAKYAPLASADDGVGTLGEISQLAPSVGEV